MATGIGLNDFCISWLQTRAIKYRIKSYMNQMNQSIDSDECELFGNTQRLKKAQMTFYSSWDFLNLESFKTAKAYLNTMEDATRSIRAQIDICRECYNTVKACEPSVLDNYHKVKSSNSPEVPEFQEALIAFNRSVVVFDTTDKIFGERHIAAENIIGTQSPIFYEALYLFNQIFGNSSQHR